MTFDFNKDAADLTDKEITYLKARCEASRMDFTRFAMRRQEGTRFQVNWHHRVIAAALRRVDECEINRLIVNMPPGFGKTKQGVTYRIARALAINPRARFIHVSAIDVLVNDNSTDIRDTVSSDWYSRCWPLEIRKDTKAKGLWRTTAGGGLLARPAGAGITGFRAGRLEPGYTGEFISDDPMRPEDAYSTPIRERINRRYNSTFTSRLAHIERTPMTLFMQRLSEHDTSDFLLKGGTGDKWHHLVIPAYLEPGGDPYAGYSYSHGIPVRYDHPGGATWPAKLDEEGCKKLKAADGYVYDAQYDQRPRPLGGNIFKDAFWRWYDPFMPPVFEWRFIIGDTATKTGAHNDYTVFQVWGVNAFGIYLIDQIRGKWESPAMRANFVTLWQKHAAMPTLTHGSLRGAYIEEASTGAAMPAELRGSGIPLIMIVRQRDKLTRAMDVVPTVEAGAVHLPQSAPFIPEYVAEHGGFKADMTHAHDDQVDCTIDAVLIGCMGRGTATSVGTTAAPKALIGGSW